MLYALTAVSQLVTIVLFTVTEGVVFVRTADVNARLVVNKFVL